MLTKESIFGLETYPKSIISILQTHQILGQLGVGQLRQAAGGRRQVLQLQQQQRHQQHHQQVASFCGFLFFFSASLIGGRVWAGNGKSETCSSSSLAADPPIRVPAASTGRDWWPLSQCFICRSLCVMLAGQPERHSTPSTPPPPHPPPTPLPPPIPCKSKLSKSTVVGIFLRCSWN